MDNEELLLSDHAQKRLQQMEISSQNIEKTLKDGNKVNFGERSKTVVSIDRHYKVVSRDNHVVTVIPNERNGRFDSLKYDHTSFEQLKYQVEVRNNDRAMCELGTLYLEGKMCPVDVKKARELFHRAADLGNSHAMCLLSNLYGSGKLGPSDQDLKNLWMEKAAERGNVYALGITGQKLLLEYFRNKVNGLNFSESEVKEKILYYLDKATYKGSTRTLWTLGYIHEMGILGEKNVEKAIDCYVRAGNSGSPASLLSLHNLSEKGLFSCTKLDVILNSVEKLLVKSSIGMLYEQGISQIEGELGNNRNRGLRMVESAALALKNYEKAEKTLAKLYIYGTVTDPDLRLSQYWFQELFSLFSKCANEGNIESIWELGKFYKKGYVGPIDIPKAEATFQKVIELSNDPKYMYKLGFMYFNGELGDKDPELGLDLILKSLEMSKTLVEQNNAQESHKLGIIYSNSEFPFASYNRSYYWLKKASDLGIKAANYNMACMYLNNDSGYSNIVKGLDLLRNLLLEGTIDIILLNTCIVKYKPDGPDYISWLQSNANFDVREQLKYKHVTQMGFSLGEYDLKKWSLIRLSVVYGLNPSNGFVDIKAVCQYWYILLTEFDQREYIFKLCEAHKKGILPDDMISQTKEVAENLKTLTNEETPLSFFKTCNILYVLLSNGVLLPTNLLESAKYKCIYLLYKSTPENSKNINIMDHLPKKIDDSIIQTLKSTDFIVSEIIKLAEKLKKTSVGTTKILCRILGDIYCSGLIGEKDLDKAITWYERASERNNSRASYALAQLYNSESKKNLYKSLKYYKLAVTQGHQDALKELDSFIEKNEMFKTHSVFLDSYNFISSIPKDVVQKVQPYKNLTEYPSNSESMHQLAVQLLHKDNPSEDDINNGMFWMRKASKINPCSLIELFLVYKSGLLGNNVKIVADRIKIKIARKFLSLLDRGNELKKYEFSAYEISQLNYLKKMSEEEPFTRIMDCLEKCTSTKGDVFFRNIKEIVNILKLFVNDSVKFMTVIKDI